MEKKSETFFSNFQYNPDNINNIESYSMLKNKKQGNNVDNYEKINKKNKIISQDETKKNTTVKIIWEKLNNLSKREKIKGIVLIADEGINGTVSGFIDGIKKLEKYSINL